jgi:uncharacterized protein YbaA (DUF1428 family)
MKTRYVDGFVLTVPKAKTAAYRKMAKEAAAVWKKFGALLYRECKIDDAKPPFVTFTFPEMAKSRRGENVWFSYIEYRSKKHRDSVNSKVMAYFDKKYAGKDMPMPFDMKRFAYGGFSVEVQS